jgi:hypothetical protein
VASQIRGKQRLDIVCIPIPKWFSVKPSIGEAITVNIYPEFTGNHSGLGISLKSYIPIAKYFSVGVEEGVDKEGVYFENRKT